MNQRREVGEAEQKATAELVALRRKEIKVGILLCFVIAFS